MPEKSRFFGKGCGKSPVWAKGTHGLAGSHRELTCRSAKAF